MRTYWSVHKPQFEAHWKHKVEVKQTKKKRINEQRVWFQDTYDEQPEDFKKEFEENYEKEGEEQAKKYKDRGAWKENRHSYGIYRKLVNRNIPGSATKHNLATFNTEKYGQFYDLCKDFAKLAFTQEEIDARKISKEDADEDEEEGEEERATADELEEHAPPVSEKAGNDGRAFNMHDIQGLRSSLAPDPSTENESSAHSRELTSPLTSATTVTALSLLLSSSLSLSFAGPSNNPNSTSFLQYNFLQSLGNEGSTQGLWNWANDTNILPPTSANFKETNISTLYNPIQQDASNTLLQNPANGSNSNSNSGNHDGLDMALQSADMGNNNALAGSNPNAVGMGSLGMGNGSQGMTMAMGNDTGVEGMIFESNANGAGGNSNTMGVGLQGIGAGNGMDAGGPYPNAVGGGFQGMGMGMGRQYDGAGGGNPNMVGMQSVGMGMGGAGFGMGPNMMGMGMGMGMDYAGMGTATYPSQPNVMSNNDTNNTGMLNIQNLMAQNQFSAQGQIPVPTAPSPLSSASRWNDIQEQANIAVKTKNNAPKKKTTRKKAVNSLTPSNGPEQQQTVDDPEHPAKKKTTTRRKTAEIPADSSQLNLPVGVRKPTRNVVPPNWYPAPLLTPEQAKVLEEAKVTEAEAKKALKGKKGRS
ncbi:hypothetical protein V5O48_018180 [Marasmius crinis-equi]|uniref:Uncharacterized protein n=1 Tax=Marasmius crinis-equi TaxID=585013 RepID=A0ABR3ELY8_9AGAR